MTNTMIILFFIFLALIGLALVIRSFRRARNVVRMTRDELAMTDDNVATYRHRDDL